MRRFTLVLMLFGIGLIAPAAATATLTVDQLAAADVVFDTGVTLGDADRTRLQTAADDLAEKSFPTKFAVVAKAPKDLDQLANELRSGLALRVGIDNIDGVLILGPNELGIAADAFPTEIREAFDAELPVLRADGVQGMINVANRLQAKDEANALPGDEDAPTGGGPSGFAIAALVAVGVFGLLAMVFARRSAKRGAERKMTGKRSALDLMVDALAAHITDIGADIPTSPNATKAKPFFDESTRIYEQVRAAMAQPMTEAQADDIGQDLVRGFRAARSARTVLDGGDPPTEPASPPIMDGLCAFDPQHGRARETREITTPSGDRGTIPVCAACATGLDRGERPAPRMIIISGQSVPYWQNAAPLTGNLFADDVVRQVMQAFFGTSGR